MSRGGKVHHRILEREAKDAGAILVRFNGDHAIYLLPNGKRAQFEKRADISPKSVTRFRKALAACTIEMMAAT